MQKLRPTFTVHPTCHTVHPPAQQLQRRLLVVRAAQAPSQPEQLAPAGAPQSPEDRRSCVLGLWQAQQHAAGSSRRPRRSAGSTRGTPQPPPQSKVGGEQAGTQAGQHVEAGGLQEKQGHKVRPDQQEQQQLSSQPAPQYTTAARGGSQGGPSSRTDAPAAGKKYGPATRAAAGSRGQHQGSARPTQAQAQPPPHKTAGKQPPGPQDIQPSRARHVQRTGYSQPPSPAQHSSDQHHASQQQPASKVGSQDDSGRKAQGRPAKPDYAAKATTSNSSKSASRTGHTAVGKPPASFKTVRHSQQPAAAAATAPNQSADSSTSSSLAEQYRRLRRRTSVWGPLARQRQLLLRQSIQQHRSSRGQRSLLFSMDMGAPKGSLSNRLQSGQGLPGLSKHMALLLRLTRYRPGGTDDGPAAVQAVEQYNAQAWSRAVQYACRSHGTPLRKLSLQQLAYLAAALAAANHPCPPLFVLFLSRAASAKVRRCIAATKARAAQAQGGGPWVAPLGCFLSLRISGALLAGLLRLRVSPSGTEAPQPTAQSRSGGIGASATPGAELSTQQGARISHPSGVSAAGHKAAQVLASALAQWMALALGHTQAAAAQPARTKSSAIWTATSAWALVALLGSLPSGLEHVLATQVLLNKGRLPHLLPALPALHLAAALERHPPSTSPPPGLRGATKSSATAAGQGLGPPVRQGTLLAIKRLVQQAKTQAGTLNLEELAHMYACLGMCGKAVLAEAAATSTVGGKARTTDSLLRRLSRLVRARLNSFKPRQLAVILTSLAAMHRRWGAPLEPLLLNEASKWAVHKMCNASPAQAAATIRALASMGWYSSGLWERAASGPLTRWDSDLLAAMSAQQIAGVAAAYAAVGHYSPALETRTAELLELSTSLHSGKSTSLVGNG